MKSYREIADSVFARREQYMAAQRKKKQIVARTTVSVGSVALVSLAGFALYKNGVFREQLPATDGVTTTTTTTPAKTEDTATATTTAAPTETEDATTVTTTATTTATGESTTPSKTEPTTTSKTEPVKTTTPSKTESTKTTATTAPTTAPKKTVIAATEPDNGFANQSGLRKKGKYISRLLRQMMEAYKDCDVVFAVYVQIPITDDDLYEDFWGSSEELSQFYKEYYDVYNAFADEAKRLNPSWDGVDEREIEVWTDTMRANREYWLTLVDKRKQLEEQYKGPYVQSVLNQRFEILKTVSETEPIDVACDELPLLNVIRHAYYVELTSEQIDILAEHGGYVFRLATLGLKDYVPGLLNG